MIEISKGIITIVYNHDYYGRAVLIVMMLIIIMMLTIIAMLIMVVKRQ